MIPLARPVIESREEELVLEVLRSRRLSLGPKLPQFEKAFADWLGVDHAAAVSSGTAGLHLAVREAGIEPGDRVITTPLSFVSSANCILYEKARPVFVDIDRRTLNIDPAAIDAAAGESTTGVLPVHLFGYPADMPAIERVAAKHALWIVEDACEALGAAHADGTRVGGRGNLTVFAFYANKQMTTGEGGMVVCPSEEVKAALESLRNQGRAPDMGWLDHDRLGYNYRLSGIACALGLAQLEKLDAMLAGRARVAELYGKALAGIEGLELPCPDDGDRRGWFVYVVQVPADADRDRVIEGLRERGVDSKPYMPVIHLMSFYRDRFGHREGEFPVAEDVSRRSLALPFFPELTESEVEQVAGALREALAASYRSLT